MAFCGSGGITFSKGYTFYHAGTAAIGFPEERRSRIMRVTVHDVTGGDGESGEEE